MSAAFGGRLVLVYDTFSEGECSQSLAVVLDENNKLGAKYASSMPPRNAGTATATTGRGGGGTHGIANTSSQRVYRKGTHGIANTISQRVCRKGTQ